MKATRNLRKRSTKPRKKTKLSAKYDDIFSSVQLQAEIAHDSLRLVEKIKRRKANSFYYPTMPMIALKERRASESDQSQSSNSSLSLIDTMPIEDCDSIGNSPSQSDDDRMDDSRSCVCECGNVIEGHMELHKHLVMTHSDYFNCSVCRKSMKKLETDHVCEICNQFHINLEAHFETHYQDRSSEGALMECQYCYKTYTSVKEVREHERKAHHSHRIRPSKFDCQFCCGHFDSMHVRDNHIVTHIDAAVGGVWDRINDLQEKLTDQTLVNQCPLCLSVMGSRKSFRMHIVQRHLAHNPSEFLGLCGISIKDLKLGPLEGHHQKKIKIEIKQEPQESDFEAPVRISPIVAVKQEVLEE